MTDRNHAEGHGDLIPIERLNKQLGDRSRCVRMQTSQDDCVQIAAFARVRTRDVCVRMQTSWNACVRM